MYCVVSLEDKHTLLLCVLLEGLCLSYPLVVRSLLCSSSEWLLSVWPRKSGDRSCIWRTKTSGWPRPYWRWNSARLLLHQSQYAPTLDGWWQPDPPPETTSMAKRTLASPMLAWRLGGAFVFLNTRSWARSSWRGGECETDHGLGMELVKTKFLQIHFPFILWGRFPEILKNIFIINIFPGLFWTSATFKIQ